jgi:hypothetical protein
MDAENANNTYVEILVAYNLSAPAIPYTVIDRSVLGVPTLNLVGFDNVGLDLFIMDISGSVYRVNNYETDP